MLFSGTNPHNLLLSAQGVTFAQAVEACKLAGVHEVVENLPNRYQSDIGERWVGLSDGLCQRLAIAGALLKRPRILIFDESKSGLDEATSEHIAETVNSLRGKVSILFIAHKVPGGLRHDCHWRCPPSI